MNSLATPKSKICISSLATLLMVAVLATPCGSAFAQRKSNQAKRKSTNSSRQSGVSDNLRRALQFRPTQKDVDYDIPTAEQIKTCRLENASKIGKRGHLVFDGSGRLLRAYLDINGDQKPDQWSYYKDGIEVYRDVDSDFDLKADQYRWLGTAGIRWARDRDQNGEIDSWLEISPEEVSMEIVEAVKQRDVKRFSLLVITETEIKALGLGKDQQAEIAKRAKEAKAQFASFARSQKIVGPKTQWVHFGGTRPAYIPAGTEGSTKDVMIYDSVQAVISTGTKHGQLALGTLIRVGDSWRLIDLPEEIKEGLAISNGGTFFNASLRSSANSDTPATAETPASQKLFAEYADLEEKLGSAKGRQLAEIHRKRASVLLEMASSAETKKDRSNWIRQMADDVSGAYQNGEFPKGYDFLNSSARKLARDKADTQDIAHVKYRALAAFFTRKLTTAKQKEYQKIEGDFVDALGEFIKEFPRANHVPDAMLQLALSAEFKDKIDEASAWYGKIAKDFPRSPIARKAAGARIRLNCEGKTVAFSGKTVRGDNWQLTGERDKVVLIQFWATWCEPCKEDLTIIKRMYSKYEDDGLSVVSVSVDDSAKDLQGFLSKERLPWTQLYEEGGLEGPLATQLGIATLPTMLLVGKDGKVINRNITAGELDRAIQRAVR